MMLIGLAFMAGAAVLAWFSSIATMRVERTGEERATVTIESKMFGLVHVTGERINNVHSAMMVGSRVEGSDSDTPDRLVFQTAHGPVDLGYTQQLFTRDFTELKSFLDDEPPDPEIERGPEAPRLNTLSLSSTGHGEWKRFAAAQLAVVFMTFMGLLLVWSGAAAAFGGS